MDAVTSLKETEALTIQVKALVDVVKGQSDFAAEMMSRMVGISTEMKEHFGKMNERIGKLEGKINNNSVVVNRNFAVVIEKIGKMDERIGKMDERIEKLEEKLDKNSGTVRNGAAVTGVLRLVNDGGKLMTIEPVRLNERRDG